MSSRNMAMACMSLLGAVALLGSEARAGGMRTTAGAQGTQMRGCRDLVTMKHPDARGAARKREQEKCMADPDGYNR